jgi:hypothetical protein
MLAALRAFAVLLALAPLAACEEPAAPDPFATAPARALAPPEVGRVYAAIEAGDPTLAKQLDDVVARGDHRFVAVLIEALRANQIGVLGSNAYNDTVIALERLSGQRFGADWIAWVSWYPTTSLAPPPGFAEFKGRLLGKADPALGRLFAHSAGADADEIVWSGAAPEPVPAGVVGHVVADAAELDGAEPVVGVALGGESRAYPLRWLDWHEVANDTLGGRSIAVVWCGFCASARAFDVGMGGGKRRFLASSGLVLESVRLLHDGSALWNELTGTSSLVTNGAGVDALEPLPAVLTTWRAWRERNPTTTVLARDASDAAVDRGAPYARYHASAETIFPVAITRAEPKPKQLVHGLENGFRQKAWLADALLGAEVTNDAVGDQPVVLVATRGRIELEATDGRRTVVFSPGAEIRAYARGADTFHAGANPDELLDASGAAWIATDLGLVSPAGTTHRRLPGTSAYWFAWQAFHPDTELGEAAD